MKRTMKRMTIILALGGVVALAAGQILVRAHKDKAVERDLAQANQVGAEALPDPQRLTLAVTTHADGEEKVLIVRGASHLLETLEAQSDLERIRTLFDDIESKNDLIRLLELAKDGDGVRIFIGSENRLFSLSGSSIVAAPYTNTQGKIVGVIGVLGPTRLNYGRIIPMVDYTAKVIGRLLG